VISGLSPEALLAAVTAHQRAGRAAEAEAACDELLRVVPGDAGALHVRSLLAAEAGQAARALELADAAVRAEPSVGRYHAARGDALRALGRLDEAEAAFARALELDAGSCEAHGGLGNVLALRGRIDDAIDAYREAIRLDPSYHKAQNNLGNALMKKGDLAGAVACFEAALAARPGLFRVHANLGNALRGLGRLDDAIASYERALAIEPRHLPTLNNLGIALERRGEVERAIGCFRRALEVEPSSFEALLNLGAALRVRGRLEESVASLRRALAIKPASAEAHNDLGAALLDLGDLEGAARACRRAVELAPAYHEAHANLGVALQRAGQLGEAIARCRRALELAPGAAEARNNLGGVLRDAGEIPDAIASFREAIRLRPGFAEAHSNLLLSLHYDEAASPEAIFAEHLAWAERHAHGLEAALGPLDADRAPERRLRVGYLSPDLRGHSVAFFLEPALEARDRERFEVVCYADVAAPDAVTARLRGLADEWRDVTGLSDAHVAALVRRDRVDVLVDLAGHTAHGRPLVFARRPAPVQVSWLGYPDTTGLAAVGHRFTDAVADPPGATEALHTEALVRLAGGAWCYRPPEACPDVAPLPSAERGFVTFGSFNALAKVAPGTVALWSRVLERVPGSRLLLKSTGLGDEGVRSAIAARFARHGIGAERLRLLPWEPSPRHHLELYGEVDVALDTSPYHGTTTTCEALWMGVPVVSLTGRTHVSRVGASLLERVGLGALACSTSEGYVEQAVMLASRPAELSALRASLRERVRRSPLADARRLARAIEDAYRAMWRAWAAG
jgi:predicted O-linked N-acetylglucosamine transferase (SPINDLY family)